ncbi:ankyrin repeat domain-containing protein [Wenyingzhuangia sp. chi5]|uniref:Ankyrin repeat domain-containing protein n=1 Tax=Wenyingzhuangia gilva TaxID=3057677 RepID=A0ABT8VQH0_9FLAO|nr:ankyrin repeat domain-containing protein [Wenyingzhuangia sp. chi5]MDO3694187.1 ankyrin repeat domain-containing protein [Wenyingzhuangia sp. chi5]
MKIKLLSLLLALSQFTFAQRGGPQSKNELHNRSFWQTQPTVEAVKQKIKEGNDAVTPNGAAFDAVCYAIMAKAPVKTIEYLLSLPGNDINKPTHDGRSYLMWAGYSGDIPTMELLLSKGADINIAGSHGFTWFTFTLNAGHENTKIYDLMAANGIDLKSTTRTGANAIMLLAAHSKDEKIIKYFQQKGVDAHAKDNNGNNVLFYAAQRGNLSLIKNFINKGFDYKLLNNKGENLVLYASHGGRGSSNSIEVFKYFDSLGLNMNLSNQENQNALHFVCSNTKDVNIIDYFINKGANIHQKDTQGNTPFLNACRGGNILAVNKLLPQVKNINQKNNEGISAVIYATQRINKELLDVLLANNVQLDVVDKDGNNLYYYLFNAYNNRSKAHFNDFINVLKQNNISFTKAASNTTPLHIAIEKGQVDLILTAIELGANINQKNSDGLTPLHLSAMKATNDKILKLLLSKGADKSILTDFEESTYDLAAENELLKNTDITFLK